jgi:cyclopropane fatty-acyl-phospholipid synthase-like methyltransferase
MKPFSQACENNKDPILSELKCYLADLSEVLEIGSGTGQHSVYFAKHLPHLQWYTSDLPEHHPGILQWHREAALPNLHPPFSLDLHDSWPVESVEAIFTANTLHIVSLALVRRFFEGVEKHLRDSGLLCIYGPFNYQGQFTSESNQRFDAFLKQRDPQSGIRDFEQINDFASQAGLTLLRDIAMPANNRLLIFKR